MEALMSCLYLPLLALQVEEKRIDINVTGAHWYANPIWIGIGILALIVILLLVVLAARGGGGTTIVKD